LALNFQLWPRNRQNFACGADFGFKFSTFCSRISKISPAALILCVLMMNKEILVLTPKS
jgi:hypothetical protein